MDKKRIIQITRIIKKFLLDKEMTYGELQEKIGVSRGTVYNYLRRVSKGEKIIKKRGRHKY